MLDPALRPIKTRLLSPLAVRLSGVPPVAITVSGLLTGLLAAMALALHAPRIALGLWLINRVLDGLDGDVARHSGKQTDLGGFLDIMADQATYAALPLALAWYSGETLAWIVVAVLIASFYLNVGSWMFLSAVLEKRSETAERRTTIAMPTGLIEGTETLIFFTAMLLAPAAFVPIALAMAALVFVTVLQRLRWAHRHL